MGVWWFFLRPVSAGDDWEDPQLSFGLCGQPGAGRACVIDGDTLHIRRGDNLRRVRITGFDAPELEGACPAESAKAIEARAALHAWLAEGAFEWDGGKRASDAGGTSGPPTDKYGRELRALRRADGAGGHAMLADHMLKLGLAGESGWGTSPTDWCA